MHAWFGTAVSWLICISTDQCQSMQQINVIKPKGALNVGKF